MGDQKSRFWGLVAFMATLAFVILGILIFCHTGTQ